MRKRILSAIFALSMTLALPGISTFATSDKGKILSVSAGAEVNIAYHQLSYLAIEYSEPVVSPGINGYRVADYATANLKEDYDRRPVSYGNITAVYTNAVPEQRGDKTSVPGRYVIIELEPANSVTLEDGIYKPNQNAGLATWRKAGENCEWQRTDYSELKVTQTVDVKNAAGDVLLSAGEVPTLSTANVKTPELEPFKNTSIKSRNGQTDIYFNIYLPKNYDPAKKYPLVFNSTGNGGRLNYKQQDANGNFVNIGSVVSRDRAALDFAKYEPESIIVSPQVWRNQPQEWGVDQVDDALYLMEYIEKTYSVDQNRVYALGSSFGTMLVSSMMRENAELFTAYVQCNGIWIDYGGTGDPSADRSKFISVYNEKNTTNFAGKNWYDIQPIMTQSHLAKGTYEEVKKAMADVVNNKVPVWVWHGINDESIPFLNGYSTYDLLKEMYKEKGLSDAEISKLVRVTVMEDKDFFSLGIAERHKSSPIVASHKVVLNWLFGQTKENK